MRGALSLQALCAAALLFIRAAGAGDATPPVVAAPPPPPAAPKAPVAPPAEIALSLKQDDWRVRATIKPGEPKPGQLVEVRLELARQRDVPDPTYGDLVPAGGVQLSMAMSGPGSKVRYYVRPFADTGSYGVHWTPSAKGLWTLQLAPLAAGAEAGPSVSFEVGVGVPMPVSAQGQVVQVTRSVIGARARQKEPPLSPVMREVALRWLKLDAAAGPDPLAEGTALAALFKNAQGRVPAALGLAGPEFDKLAAEAAATSERIARLPAKERPAALRTAEVDTCLRCHVKFRDGLVEDLSKWPEVKPWAR
jgi:hypothetical protein